MSRVGHFHFKYVEKAGLNNFIVNRSQKQSRQARSVIYGSVCQAGMMLWAQAPELPNR